MLPPFDSWLTAAVCADVIAASRASAASLAARQTRRLGALLAAAGAHSPMYRPLLAHRDVARIPLGELPIVRKPELMRRFDEWVGDPEIRLDEVRRFIADPVNIGAPFLGRYMVWESSGSTGEPAVFIQDAAAMATYDALEGLRKPDLRPTRRWFDPCGLSERIVFVGATGGHFASTVSIERLRRLNPLLASSVHSVSFLQPAEKVIDALHRLSPTVVATYPSAAVMLAEEQLAGRLRIAPQEIWTGGETLSPAMRARIRSAFDCPVVNSYGTSEFLSLATECALGSMHLNSDWAILEPVDARGDAVAPGTAGATTLLTNLANHVQPLIRYDVGDRVTLEPAACACGSRLPVIDVQGRCDEMLVFGSGRKVRILPLGLTTVLEDAAALFDFQLVQDGSNSVVLSIGEGGGAGKSSLRRGLAVLSAFLAEQGAGRVRVRGSSGHPARVGRSGKVQRVVGLRPDRS